MTSALVTAHAGCLDTAADSLESVIAGIRAGADVIEVDVRVLPDGTPVLSHDPFPVERGESLVRLEKVVEIIFSRAGVKLNMDMKEARTAAAVLPSISPLLAEKRVFATGLFPRDIPVFAHECPGVPYAVNQPGRAVRFKTSSKLRAFVSESKDLGAFALNLNYLFVSKRLLAACAEEGFPVFVWTVDSVRAMRRMIALGVASITTNKVDTLMDVLRHS
ncbi:MAG: glycerophosphodiester phosphodiesterase [Spirochaetia bacterium]|jgi:glycerophosphoryl diester phosphodiesterase